MSRLPRFELAIPFVIVFAAVCLTAAEFLPMFSLVPAGGESLGDQTGGDRHSYAMALLALGIVLTSLLAVFGGQRPAAIAAAGLAVAALMIFLAFDLPDAGKIGDLEDEIIGLATAEATPGAGFWLTAISTVILSLATIALATLTPEQLREIGDRILARRRRDQDDDAGKDRKRNRSPKKNDSAAEGP